MSVSMRVLQRDLVEMKPVPELATRHSVHNVRQRGEKRNFHKEIHGFSAPVYTSSGNLMFDSPEDDLSRIREKLWSFHGDNRGRVAKRPAALPPVPYRISTKRDNAIPMATDVHRNNITNRSVDSEFALRLGRPGLGDKPFKIKTPHSLDSKILVSCRIKGHLKENPFKSSEHFNLKPILPTLIGDGLVRFAEDPNPRITIRAPSGVESKELDRSYLRSILKENGRLGNASGFCVVVNDADDNDSLSLTESASISSVPILARQEPLRQPYRHKRRPDIRTIYPKLEPIKSADGGGAFESPHRGNMLAISESNSLHIERSRPDVTGAEKIQPLDTVGEPELADRRYHSSQWEGDSVNVDTPSDRSEVWEPGSSLPGSIRKSHRDMSGSHSEAERPSSRSGEQLGNVGFDPVPGQFAHLTAREATEISLGIPETHFGSSTQDMLPAPATVEKLLEAPSKYVRKAPNCPMHMELVSVPELESSTRDDNSEIGDVNSAWLSGQLNKKEVINYNDYDSFARVKPDEGEGMRGRDRSVSNDGGVYDITRPTLGSNRNYPVYPKDARNPIKKFGPVQPKTKRKTPRVESMNNGDIVE